MTLIGITGHQSIPDIARRYIIDGLREVLSQQPKPLIGLSSLAAGADQLFAWEILTVGGDLHAVIPTEHYEDSFTEVELSCYFELRNRASVIKTLDYDSPSEEAFDTAGRTFTELSDVMIAVWDGKAARGHGGTGDAGEHARRNGKTVHIIWPAGVTRDCTRTQSGFGIGSDGTATTIPANAISIRSSTRKFRARVPRKA